jgi:two-component system CheB/CheR fusion protein
MVIVGVGASAGGIEACGQLLENVPADRGLSFVIVQHLDPDHESVLPEILARHSRLKVTTISGQEKIEPNRVYVLPPNRSVVMEYSKLKLVPRKRTNGGPPTPIDQFFASLAAHEGNRAVAVLLSGTGTDGTLGMKQIKAEAGITFAQDDRSASSHGMPASAIAAGIVDFVMSPAGIAKELVRIAGPPQLRKLKRGNTEEELPGTDGELTRIFALLRALNGVDFSYYKTPTIKRRILRRMVVVRIPSLREYVTHLQQNPSEVDALFQDLLINVTEFFRDPQAFQALKKKVFPAIMKNAGPQTAIRVWVPGCSTGEEVYSLAIALFEFLGKDNQRKPVQIFGTDIGDTVLARARAGIYPPSIEQEVSPERLRRFFHRVDGGYQIAKFIRDCCVFARQNLVEDPPFSKLDLVTCRNVLIYLGPVLQKKIMPIFHYALKKEGHLMLGGSETVGLFSDLFTLVDKTNKIYLKRDGQHPHLVAFRPRVADVFEPAREKFPAALPEEAPPDLQRHADRILLSHFAPAGVLVNDRMEVLEFRGQTAAFLEHPPGEASLNLMKLVKPDLVVELRTLIARATKLDSAARKECVAFHEGGRKLEAAIEVIPFRATPSRERFFLVLFKEEGASATRGGAESGRMPRTAGPRAAKDARSHRDAHVEVTRLREELSATKDSLQAIIEEQEGTNEELKSANEEIQSSNEELQSTNEELETAKEELQSTNEELTTLNEELQNRNAELSVLNNDLTNVLSSVSIPILMLGPDLAIRRFTPAAERFFNLIRSDVGRRITDINPNIIVRDLDKVVAAVIETLHVHEQEVQDRDGRWYSLRVRPYRTIDNKIDGAVILLVDIGDLKRALEELTSVMPQPLLTLGGDLRVTRANEAFHHHFNTSAEAIEGKSIYEACGGAWNVPAMHAMLEEVLPEKNRVDGHRVESQFPRVGKRVLSLNARRIRQPSKGTQVILVAIEEVT